MDALRRERERTAAESQSVAATAMQESQETGLNVCFVCWPVDSELGAQLPKCPVVQFGSAKKCTLKQELFSSLKMKKN